MLQEINVSDFFVLPKERFSFVYNLKKSSVKILSTIVAVTFLSVMPSQAQGLETLSNTTGYIDCSYGVTIITQELKSLVTATYSGYKFGSTTTTAKSLYALNANGEPETLLWVRIPSRNTNPDKDGSWSTGYFEFSILPGTKRIAKGAFEDCTNIIQLNIPSSIKFIPENGFDGLNSHAMIDIKDDAFASITSQQVSTAETEEMARYNLQGMRIDEDAHGVQIVQYSDGSAKKIINK